MEGECTLNAFHKANDLDHVVGQLQSGEVSPCGCSCPNAVFRFLIRMWNHWWTPQLMISRIQRIT